MIKAYTLLEMAVVVAIIALLLAMASPLFSRQIAESRFQAAAAEFAGHLILARSYAQLSEEPVKLDFDPTGIFRYRVLAMQGEDWRQLAGAVAAPTRKHGIAIRLPAMPLPHPTTKRTLTRALTSNHGEEVFFSAAGSSAATLVLSDGGEHALCAVIASSSGRFRIYSWSARKQAWDSYY